MKVLIDTSIWSKVLRRQKHDHALSVQIDELIDEQRVEIIGPIRQELLSGIRNPQQFQFLKEKMRAFVDLELHTSDYERAAEMANNCRSQGIQGSSVDFLICSVSEQRHLAIFTADRDFEMYAKYLPIKLFHWESINH